MTNVLDISVVPATAKGGNYFIVLLRVTIYRICRLQLEKEI